LLFVTVSCGKDNEGLDVLLAENSQLSNSYESQLAETRQALERADSLQTVVNKLHSEVQGIKGQPANLNKASKADEQAIESLVDGLHKGWSSMFKTDNANDVLKYFLPEYTTSAVRIDVENIPSVRRKNDQNFEQFLNQLIAVEGVSLTFGETKFLYTEVKGDAYVTSYRTTIRLYEHNKLLHTGSIITQLAGERVDGEWKVGSYHWVNFNYS
jgi:hypothetical protein